MAISELFHLPQRLKVECEWLKEAKYFEKVDSTQSRITQFLSKEADGPIFLIAETQTKGTGRQGRPWVSPEGGIWFSFAIPLGSIEPAHAASFSMVVALKCAEALQEVNDLKASIKWPNDILHDGKKLGGIILSNKAKFRKPWLIIGIGINVNNEVPGVKDATSIMQVRGQSQGRSRLIEAILNNLWTAWQDFDRTGFGPYQKSVEKKLVGVGKITNIAIGKKTLKGTLIGVDPKGGLLIKSNSETKTVQAGEIVGQLA